MLEHDVTELSRGLLEAQEQYCKRRIDTGDPCEELRKEVERFEAKLREAVAKADAPVAPLARTLLSKQDQFFTVMEKEVRRGTKAYFCEFQAWQDASKQLRKAVGLPTWALTLKKVPRVFS